MNLMQEEEHLRYVQKGSGIFSGMGAGAEQSRHRRSASADQTERAEVFTMRFRETIIQNISITRRAGEKCRFMLFLLLLIMISAFAGILGDSVRTQAASSKEGVFCQESFFVPEASCASDAPVYKYYTSIQIQKGDTLWKIAGQYRTEECGSMEDYIEEICALNHISRDSIHSGQYLTIPYYSIQYLE